jgi:hypothetical protein
VVLVYTTDIISVAARLPGPSPGASTKGVERAEKQSVPSLVRLLRPVYGAAGPEPLGIRLL